MKNKLNEKNGNTRNSQGITLVALVITVILLLVLAGVAINMAINSDGLFAKANEAVKGWNSGVGEEENSIRNLLTIAENIGKEEEKWVYDHATQTVARNGQEFHIGDYIKYDAPESTGYTGVKKWRVLGEEDGKLLLVSTDLVYSETTKGQQYPMTQLSGDSSGVNNAIDELNRIGALYINTEMADSGRSINLADVNRITGYDPERSYLDASDLSKTGPCFNGQPYQYGNTVTYTIKDEKVWYKGDKVAPFNDTQTVFTTFKLPGSENDITEATPVKSTSFDYYAETLGDFEKSSVATDKQAELKGLKSDSQEYDVLFNKFGSSCPPYWLASSYAYPDSGRSRWGLCCVNTGGHVFGYDCNYYLWLSDSGSLSLSCGVRAVVSLKSNIIPEIDDRT